MGVFGGRDNSGLRIRSSESRGGGPEKRCAVALRLQGLQRAREFRAHGAVTDGRDGIIRPRVYLPL